MRSVESMELKREIGREWRRGIGSRMVRNGTIKPWQRATRSDEERRAMQLRLEKREGIGKQATNQASWQRREVRHFEQCAIHQKGGRHRYMYVEGGKLTTEKLRWTPRSFTQNDKARDGLRDWPSRGPFSVQWATRCGCTGRGPISAVRSGKLGAVCETWCSKVAVCG